MEEQLNKLREIKLEETISLIKKQIGDVSSPKEFEEFSKNNKVLDVKYLGEFIFDANGTKHELYAIDELIQVASNSELGTVLTKYVTEELETLAVNVHENGFEFPTVTKSHIDKKEIIESAIKNLEEKEPLDLNKMEQKRKEEIANALNVNPEEIEDVMQEMDLKQTKKLPGDEKQETIEEDKLDDLSKKEETNLHQNIKGETLEEKLGLKEKGITDGVKLVRVSVDSLNRHLDKSITQADAFVVIRENGEAVVLDEDIIRPDSRLGINPNGEQTTIGVDGKVSKEGITSSFEIVNRPGEYIQAGNDEQFGKEIKLAKYSNRYNSYIGVELETQNTPIQYNEVHQYMKENGRDETDNMIEKANAHEDLGCEPNVQDIDNSPDNNTHEHFDTENEMELITEQDVIPETDITWGEFKEKCKFSTFEETKERFKKAQEENPEKTNNDILDIIEEEENEMYIHGRGRGY